MKDLDPRITVIRISEADATELTVGTPAEGPKPEEPSGPSREDSSSEGSESSSGNEPE